MVYFNIPGFHSNHDMLLDLCRNYRYHPEMFKDGAIISSVYDSFPGCSWNGGRVPMLRDYTFSAIESCIREFNDLGVGLRFVFTNTHLSESDVHDTLGNLILMLIRQNPLNDVVVKSDILYNYIRKMCPEMRIIRSCTGVDMDISQYEFDKYDLCCMYMDLNNTDELLKIPCREKIELIPNSYCGDNCPLANEHYRWVSLMCKISSERRDFTEEEKIADSEFEERRLKVCQDNGRLFEDLFTDKHFITVEDVYNKYSSLGINHFKLVDRFKDYTELNKVFNYYLYKEEYIWKPENDR